VTVISNGRKWERDFNGFKFSSSLGFKNGVLMENFPLFNLGYQLKMINQLGKVGFANNFKQMWILNLIPVPDILAVKADAITLFHDNGNGFYIDVSVKLPIFGEIIRYEGDVCITK